MGLETEVKFYLADLQPVRDRLAEVGATLTRPRVFERNVVFDTAGMTLKNSLRLLRLRQDERVTLTFKGPAIEDQESEAKVREEIEVEAADFATLAAILEKIGYAPQLVYEKYRETYELGDVEILLDELPYGQFVELEGNETGIKLLAAELGLSWEERILTDYLNLMRLLKQKVKLPFEDITFDNFAGVNLPLWPFDPSC